MVKVVNTDTGEERELRSENSAKTLIENSDDWELAEGEEIEGWSVNPVEDLGGGKSDWQPKQSQGEGEKADADSLEAWAQSGNWLSADAVEKGDTMTILSPAKMQEYEDSKYPVIGVDYQGEQFNLRLNKENSHNIAEAWGWDSENWVGNDLKIVSIRTYSNLPNNPKGMILEPVEE